MRGQFKMFYVALEILLLALEKAIQKPLVRKQKIHDRCYEAVIKHQQKIKKSCEVGGTFHTILYESRSKDTL